MEEKKERIKKEYDRKNGQTQKLMTFRCDLENIEALKTIANRGRLINSLLRDYFESKNRDESYLDRDPAGDTSEDTRP